MGNAGARTSDGYRSIGRFRGRKPSTQPVYRTAQKSCFPFFPSRAAPVERVSSLPRVPLERGFFRAARRSTIVATIDPQCLTYRNKSSFPIESSLCTSPTPNRCKRFGGFDQVDSWRRCFEQQITSSPIRWRSRSCQFQERSHICSWHG